MDRLVDHRDGVLGWSVNGLIELQSCRQGRDVFAEHLHHVRRRQRVDEPPSTGDELSDHLFEPRLDRCDADHDHAPWIAVVSDVPGFARSSLCQRFCYAGLEERLHSGACPVRERHPDAHVRVDRAWEGKRIPLLMISTELETET